MKKQSLIKGSLILGIAGIITRFLGLFFRWPLIMLIGDEGIGYYQMSYPLYMFFVAMASGIPITVSKLISENNAVNNIKGNFEVIKETIILMIMLGFGTSFVLFFFSKSIIVFLNWDSKAYYSLVGISFAPLIVSLLMAFRGFFQGFQSMTYPAISQILEQIGRVVFGVGLAVLLLPKGIEYSAGGAAFGAAAGGLIALIYLYFKYIKVKRQYKIKNIQCNTEMLGKILKISIPISLGATASSIMNLMDSILVPNNLIKAGLSSKNATILYAQLTGKASVIINIPFTLSIAICTSLLPIIAELFVLKKRDQLRKKVNTAIKISQIISIPCTLGLFFLASPIMNLIFPGRADGADILKYLSIVIPFIVVTQVTTSILQGIGRYISPVINLIIGCIIKMILTIVLVRQSNINIYGAVIATIVAYVIVAILNVIRIKRKINIRIDIFNNFIKPLFASVIMIITVLICYMQLYTYTGSNGIACLLSISIGGIIYILAIVVLKIFSIKEIKSKMDS